MTKKVIHHLAQAVIIGYEWAPAALENMFEYQQRHMTVQDYREESLGDAISTAFIWAETKQGHDYWAAIRNNPDADLDRVLDAVYM